MNIVLQSFETFCQSLCDTIDERRLILDSDLYMLFKYALYLIEHKIVVNNSEFDRLIAKLMTYYKQDLLSDNNKLRQCSYAQCYAILLLLKKNNISVIEN